MRTLDKSISKSSLSEPDRKLVHRAYTNIIPLLKERYSFKTITDGKTYFSWAGIKVFIDGDFCIRVDSDIISQTQLDDIKVYNPPQGSVKFIQHNLLHRIRLILENELINLDNDFIKRNAQIKILYKPKAHWLDYSEEEVSFKDYILSYIRSKYYKTLVGNDKLVHFFTKGIWKIANREIIGTCYGSFVAQTATIGDYNLVAKHGSSFLRLQKESGNISLLAVNLIRDKAVKKNSLSVVKEKLKNKGMTELFWKWLCKQNRTSIKIVSSYLIKNILVKFSNKRKKAESLQTFSSLQNILPHSSKTILIKFTIQLFQDIALYQRNVSEHFLPNFALATRLLDKQSAVFIKRNFLELVDYITNEPIKLDKKTGLSRLMQRSVIWHQNVYRNRWGNAQQNVKWPTLLQPFIYSNCSIQEFGDSESLYQEGLTMQHCVVTYTDHCIRGGSRIFSIVNISPDGSSTPATLELVLDNLAKWEIRQLRGVSNSLIENAEILLAASFIETEYNRLFASINSLGSTDKAA